MIVIPQDHIPVLEAKDIVDGECVAYGISKEGMIIHFIETDSCILVEWSEIILYGSRILKEKHNKPNDQKTKPCEIDHPTEV